MTDMTKSLLYKEFGKLSLNSKKSVQGGQSLSDLDAYLHVQRPIEILLRDKMREIDEVGGGIVLLIGSAGDGKSHLLSRVRSDFDWEEGAFYNDATASCSPTMTAVQTLKEVLKDFSDSSIETTRRKLVLAINLGKLNAFIEDSDVRKMYSKIVHATDPIFDDDDTTDEVETDRIKIVLFSREQVFEVDPTSSEEYPVSSTFMRSILDRIILESNDNPFKKAYDIDAENEEHKANPVLLNYDLLRSPAVRDTIVKTIIEAIVRYKLIITPREFLDFVFSVMVHSDLDRYVERDDFFSALLPTTLFSGGDNLILKAVAKLDPVLSSNTQHDRELAELFLSYQIPEGHEISMSSSGVPSYILLRVNEFFKNNGRNIDQTTQFVFRLAHIISYHSESAVYKRFITTLPKLLCADGDAMLHVYDLVAQVIPRHFGSFYDKPNMVPLEVQGGKYKLFTNLSLEPLEMDSVFNAEYPNRFPLYVNLKWSTGTSPIMLKVDFQMYSYLCDLASGRLVTSFDAERSRDFGCFVKELSSRSNPDEVTIVKFDGQERKLRSFLGNVRLV